MIKDFTPRLYQETVFHTTTKKNTLVVLPTGMGKTSIALMLTAHRLNEYPDSRIMVLAPTKPLADQIKTFLQSHLEIEADSVKLFTGHIQPEKRASLYKESKIIVSTPQTIENDIIRNNIELKDISLCVFDEAHRAVGDYSYKYVAEQYKKKSRFPKILALTASPGSEVEKITEVCQNLSIDTIEVRTEDDPDVAPYIQNIDMKWVAVNVPDDFKDIKKYLRNFVKDKLTQIKDYGYTHPSMITNYTRKDILSLQGKLRGELADNPKDFNVMRCISLAAEVMKIEHALELLETQGIVALWQYMEKLEKEGYNSKTKAAQNVVKDINFRSAYMKSKSEFLKGTKHPKMNKLQEIIEEQIRKDPNSKIIVFNQYRDNAQAVVDMCNTEIKDAEAKLFVGQAKKNGSGLSQKKQLAIIEEFRNNSFNILVSSSVGEEGLDIPAVDLVIFYEPIPSAIRHIQRRGRTARLEKGKVIILMAKGTRDEGYRWSAHHKENRMHRILGDLKNKIQMIQHEKEVQESKHVTLDKFSESDIEIIVDDREVNTHVVKQLRNLTTNLKVERLEVGDFILSNRVCAEFKTTNDFLESLIDGRLLSQAKVMRQHFSRPVIIVQGEEDIYKIRNVHPHSIMGFVSTLNISYGIPIIFTKNEIETSKYLFFIAKRENDEIGKITNIFGGRKPKDLKEQQLALVASIPGIGNLARPLLQHFRTIKNIVNADIDKLKEVEQIGPTKAKKIKELMEKEFKD